MTAKRAIGYGRVSTGAQLKGTSKEEQDRKTRGQAQQDGHPFVKFVSDDGRSGKSIKGRPGIQEIIRAARAREFEILYFTKLDRLARNLRDLLNIWSELEEVGLELVCVDQPAVNTTEGNFGTMMVQLLGMFAEFERRLIRERTEGGRKIVWEKGESRIGGTPYGYLWNEQHKTYEICPSTSPIYLQIVSMYLDQNLTYKDIAISLTREGIAPPSARKWKKRKAPAKWNANMVGKILKNPAYRGEAVHNRFVHKENVEKCYHAVSKEEKPEEEWITVIFPPLVTEERWGQIEAMIEHRKRRPKKKHKGYEEHYLVENIVRCGECGGRMIKRSPRKGADGRMQFRYACYWKHASAKEAEASGRKKCILGAIDAEKMDKKILNEVSSFISDPNRFAKAWLKDLNLEELKQKVERLEMQQSDLKASLARGFTYVHSTQDDELQEMYRQQQKGDERVYWTTKQELEKARRGLELASSKYKRIAEFRKIAKRTSRWTKKGLPVDTAWQVERFFWALPFEERKRSVEAIIAPDQGGRAEIRYLTPKDVLDCEQLGKLTREARVQPLTDMALNIDLKFEADLNRIETAIIGLDRKELLDKIGYSRVALSHVQIGYPEMGLWRENVIRDKP